MSEYHISEYNPSGYTTPGTVKTMTTMTTCTDTSDDFLLLSDSPSYEDIASSHLDRY